MGESSPKKRQDTRRGGVVSVGGKEERVPPLRDKTQKRKKGIARRGVNQFGSYKQ